MTGKGLNSVTLRRLGLSGVLVVSVLGFNWGLNQSPVFAEIGSSALERNRGDLEQTIPRQNNSTAQAVRITQDQASESLALESESTELHNIKSQLDSKTLELQETGGHAEPSEQQAGAANGEPALKFDLPPGPTGEAAESGLKDRLMKFALVLLGVVGLMYVLFHGFRRTPIYKQMATNPVRIKSVTPTGGKTKLLLVEVYGSQLLLAANEQSLNFIKEFEPHRLRQYQLDQAQQEVSSDRKAFEAAIQKPVSKRETGDVET
jgi:flagellar biogenesis protein FliO